MPTAEKAMKERDCTQMPVAKKERTDHKCAVSYFGIRATPVLPQ